MNYTLIYFNINISCACFQEHYSDSLELKKSFEQCQGDASGSQLHNFSHIQGRKPSS